MQVVLQGLAGLASGAGSVDRDHREVGVRVARRGRRDRPVGDRVGPAGRLLVHEEGFDLGQYLLGVGVLTCYEDDHEVAVGGCLELGREETEVVQHAFVHLGAHGHKGLVHPVQGVALGGDGHQRHRVACRAVHSVGTQQVAEGAGWPQRGGHRRGAPARQGWDSIGAPPGCRSGDPPRGPGAGSTPPRTAPPARARRRCRSSPRPRPRRQGSRGRHRSTGRRVR